MPLRDMRNKLIEEGDLLAFVPQFGEMASGFVLAIGAPVAQPTPQGQLVLQKMRVAVVFEFTSMPNSNVPLVIVNRKDDDAAKEALADVKKLVERLVEGKGGSGGSIVMST